MYHSNLYLHIQQHMSHPHLEKNKKWWIEERKSETEKGSKINEKREKNKRKKQTKKQKNEEKKLRRRVLEWIYLRLCDSSLTSQYRYSTSQLAVRARFELKVKEDSDGWRLRDSYSWIRIFVDFSSSFVSWM